MSGDQLNLDAIEARANAAAEASAKESGGPWWVDGPALRSGKYWVYATGEKFDSREIAEHIAGMDPGVTLALVAEVRRLREERDRLALLLGRRMTGPEIGAALSHMIDSGALVIPPEGSPTLTTEQVRAELGIDPRR